MKREGRGEQESERLLPWFPRPFPRPPTINQLNARGFIQFDKYLWRIWSPQSFWLNSLLRNKFFFFFLLNNPTTRTLGNKFLNCPYVRWPDFQSRKETNLWLIDNFFSCLFWYLYPNSWGTSPRPQRLCAWRDPTPGSEQIIQPPANPSFYHPAPNNCFLNGHVPHSEPKDTMSLFLGIWKEALPNGFEDLELEPLWSSCNHGVNGTVAYS